MTFEHIPERMKQTPHWIVWRLEDRGDPKPNKTPYCVRGGYGKVNDSTTWATFSEAVTAYQSGEFNGIGFVFTGTPFVGVDIDGCIDPGTGEVAPEAIDALNVLQSYTELSQSGKGFHIVLEGKLPDGRRKVEPFEMYGDGSPRYFAITGNQWGEWRDLRADQDAINAIHEKYIAGPARAQQEARQQAQAPKQVIPLLTLSNEQVLERARAARNGALFSSLWAGDTSRYDGDDSRADMALANMLAFWCGRDPEQMDRLFRQSGLYRPKWDERHGRDTYGNLTIAEAIAGCRDVYSGPAAKQGNNTPQVQTSPQPPPEWERPVSHS